MADNPVYLKWASRLKGERAQGKPEPTDQQLHNASSRHARRDFDDSLFGINGAALGAGREFYRMGRHLISPALQERADRLGLRFEHLAVTIGTIVHNVDLRKHLSDELVDVIRSTLLERKVVFFRGQQIDVDQHIAFAHRFGPLDAFPFGDHVEGNPEVLRVAGIGTTPANNWHTDVTWMESPSLGSILHMIEVPEIGGDTSFSDSHAAYLGLPDAVKRKMEGVCAVHDYRGFAANNRRRGVSEETIAELKKDVPFGVTHPVIRTHPETGKQALYLHGGFMRHDSLHTAEGSLGPEESKRMVRRLLTQHSRPEYQCRFKWEKGSIAFWDNRACQHCATGDYYPNVRIGHRVTISGTRPYHDPHAAVVPVPVFTPVARL